MSLILGVTGACALAVLGVLVMAAGIPEGWVFLLLAIGALVAPAVTVHLVGRRRP